MSNPDERRHQLLIAPRMPESNGSELLETLDHDSDDEPVPTSNIVESS